MNRKLLASLLKIRAYLRRNVAAGKHYYSIKGWLGESIVIALTGQVIERSEKSDTTFVVYDYVNGVNRILEGTIFHTMLMHRISKRLWKRLDELNRDPNHPFTGFYDSSITQMAWIDAFDPNQARIGGLIHLHK